IRQAVARGTITQQEIDERCRKILAIKYWAGLHRKTRVDITDINADLNTPDAKLLNRNLLEAAITVLKNENAILHITYLDTLLIASVLLDRNYFTPFKLNLPL